MMIVSKIVLLILVMSVTEKVDNTKPDDSMNGEVVIQPFEKAREEKEENLRFGWKCFQPNWLQKLNGPKGFLVFLTFFSATQGVIVNGMSPAVLPTIEKEFGFSSKKAGVILACNDISGLLLVTFVSYFGGKGHRPRWIGLGCLLTGLGALVFCFPKLIIGKYQPASTDISKHDLCLLNKHISTKDECDTLGSSKSEWSLFVFCLGQLIMGAGTAPLYTLGPSFIDDNVDPKVSPIYVGIWFATTFIGPGLGIVIGSMILQVYVDIKQPAGFSLDPNDRRWIGAWWLSYFAFSWVFLLVGFFLVGYPRELPAASERREQAIARGELKGKAHIAGTGLKSMFLTTIKLVKNKSLMLMIFGMTIRTIWGVGLGSFVIKLVVVRFGASQVVAGVSTGIIILPAMVIGVMGGSYLMKRFNIKDSTLKAIKVCTLISALSTLTTLMSLIPGCRDTNLAGVKVEHPMRPQVLGSINFTCNANCNCRRDKYSPVCGSDGLTYFSSCYAGCKDKVDDKLYKNCTCIPSVNGTFGEVKDERCDRGCKNLPVYLGVISVTIIIAFIAGTPHNMGVIRIVAVNEKSYALGLQFLIMRSLSFVPAPVIFGLILDEACFLWNRDFCGNKGECLEYKVDNLINHIVIFGIICSVGSLLFYGLSWYFYQPIDEDKIDLATPNTNPEKYTMDKVGMERQLSQVGMINEGATDCETAEETNP